MRSRSRLPRGVLVATGPVVLVVAGIVGYLSFGYSLWMAVAMTLLVLDLHVPVSAAGSHPTLTCPPARWCSAQG